MLFCNNLTPPEKQRCRSRRKSIREVFSYLWLVFPLLLAVSCGTASTFRSDGQPSRSPSKLYRAYVSNGLDHLGEPEKRLVIVCARSQAKIYEQAIQRRPELVWSPDENMVAVIEGLEDNENRIIVVRLPTGEREMEVSRDNARTLDSKSPSTQLYSHVYFSNVKWSNGRQFSATIDAYDPFWPNVPEISTARCDFVVAQRE